MLRAVPDEQEASGCHISASHSRRKVIGRNFAACLHLAFISGGKKAMRKRYANPRSVDIAPSVTQTSGLRIAILYEISRRIKRIFARLRRASITKQAPLTRTAGKKATVTLRFLLDQ